MVLRAALSALLVGIVAVFVQSGGIGGQCYAQPTDNIFGAVDVAEPRKSLIPKAIVVSDYPPDEEVVAQVLCEHCSNLLERSCPWRQYDGTLFLSGIINWEGLCIPDVGELSGNVVAFGAVVAVPTHLARWEVPDVPKDDARMYAIFSIPMLSKTGRLDADVSTLKDFSVADLPVGKFFRQAHLPPSDPYQPSCNNNEKPRKNRQDQSEQGDRVIRRSLPNGFVLLCLGGGFAGMLLGACYLWAMGMFGSKQKRDN